MPRLRVSRLAARNVDRAQSDRLADLNAMTDGAIRDVHRIATQLRSVALDNGGLAGALRWLAGDFQKRSGILPTLEIPENFDFPEDRAICIFRICQESLTNVSRHSEATMVKVRVELDGGEVAIRVQDNGDDTAHSMHLGILGMKERARILGGTVEIQSMRGAGTSVAARIPCVRRSQSCVCNTPFMPEKHTLAILQVALAI